VGLELSSDFQNLVLAAIVVIGVLAAVGALRRPRIYRRRMFARVPRRAWTNHVDLGNAGQQLHAVMESSFQRRRILSPSEYRVFKAIEDDVAAVRKGYRVFAQTSLGEILQSPDHDAYSSINSKRVDILVVDQGGWPVVAVEHQGRGHYQGTSAARDAIKKEALRKAGVRYVEIFDTDSNEKIQSRVREQLG